jgi:regulator of sigma E protease
VADAAEAGAPSYLFTGYLFSVAVAAFNILPLGILDGGHMAIYTVERIFGNGLPVRIFRTAVTVVGIAFLVAALLLTLGGDIVDIWSALN